MNDTLTVASDLAVRIFVNRGGNWTRTATLPQVIAPASSSTFPQIAFDGHYLAFVAFAPASSGGAGSNGPVFLLYLYKVHTGGQPELLGTLAPSSLTAPGGIVLANGILAVKGFDASGNGLVYVYSESSPTPNIPQILRSVEPTPDSTFGDSIAIWNQTILVGAPGAYPQPNGFTGGFFSGAAFVFSPGAHGWVQTQQIVPNNSAGFGTAVVVNQVGALISAPFSDDNFGHLLGDTQVYAWKGDQLVFVDNISSAGTSMALSGNRAIVGTALGNIRFGWFETADILTYTPGAGQSLTTAIR